MRGKALAAVVALCFTGIAGADLAVCITPAYSAPLSLFGLGLFLDILLKLASSFAYVRLKKLPGMGSILASVLIATVFSLTMLWYVLLPSFGVGSVAYDEVLVIAVDTAIMYLLNRIRGFNKDGLALKDALAMSIINNVFSFFMGTPILAGFVNTLPYPNGLYCSILPPV
ncbi:MAG: hypothetical protein KGH72_01930 [Candidatus Micrarchaeota archaeon]|nr:hypothetical protein [Candidatus Micrarchaeota archaeon]